MLKINFSNSENLYYDEIKFLIKVRKTYNSGNISKNNDNFFYNINK